MRRLGARVGLLVPLLLLAACDRNSRGGSGVPKVPEGGVVIDSDVPGTKVYFGESELGVVPVRMSAKELGKLGLPRSDADRVILGSDGWGESLFLGIEDEWEHKIHLVAPDPGLYLTAQTPWGGRTRIAGGETSADQNYFRAKLNRRTSEEVKVSLELLGRTASGLSVRVDALNRAIEPFTGHRPELLFQWGTMTTPWRTRSSHRIELPEAWNSLEPNETHFLVIDLPFADSRDGTSLFCVMSLFEDPEGDDLAGKGGIYGDSIWIAPEPGAADATGRK
jgi:hypothetical protein